MGTSNQPAAATARPPGPAVDELPRVLQVGRRYWKLIAATTLVALGASLLWSEAQTPKYTASAALYFRDPAFSQQLFGNNFLVPAQDPTRQAATNTALVTLDTVSRMTAKEIPRLTADEIKHAVSITPNGQSDVIQVRATDASPTLAARLANVFARAYITFRQTANRATLRDALSVVRRQLLSSPAGPDTAALQSRVEQLQLLESLQTANAELVQTALPPDDPSSPRTKRSAAIAAFLGLLGGLGLAFAFARFDRRLRTANEAAEILGRPLLGAVPESGSFATHAGASFPTGSEAEAFRLLRASLRYFSLGAEVRTVLVTSAAPGEGKTTVALNLARAAAEASERVLLIETDMRRPTLSMRLDAKESGGLSDVLSGQVSFADAVVRSGEDGSTSFEVLLSGPCPPNPGDLLESSSMRQLLLDVASHFDLVVLDTPPVALVPDAIPLVKLVDGVIVVARIGRSSRSALATLREQLTHLGGSIFGVVANGGRDSNDQSYGYYYAAAGSDGDAKLSVPVRGPRE